MVIEADFYTLKEIRQQPDLWGKVYNLIVSQKKDIQHFLHKLKKENGDEIILTGAGSSFFIGEIVAGYFQNNTGFSTKAVSTTEIVTHPHLYINPNKQTLLISFARSGNSPESVAAIHNANLISDNVLHLIITCNNEGELANSVYINPKYVITLPEESNDKGLAMTSSVTSMALAALLVSQIDTIEQLNAQIETASHYAARIISKYSDLIEQIASLDIERAVFLGSGPFMGVAREAHLKLQEMTDGKVICKFDSFLSFRHGPKVVLNENTLLIGFLSNDEYVRQYESDLVRAVAKEHKLLAFASVSETKPQEENVFDYEIVLTDGESKLNEQFLALCSLIPAQLLGYYKSLNLGLNPDHPSAGAIHRVVQGVTIYEMMKD